MGTKRAKAGPEARVALGEDLRIASARPAAEALGAVDPRATVVIDASSILRVDAAGLQALAVCVGRWRLAGRPWRWDNPAEPLKAAARQAGLVAALGLE